MHASPTRTPDKTIVSLDPLVCPCSTMFRIDAAHLAWVLENLVEGRVVNQITVDPEVTSAGPRRPPADVGHHRRGGHPGAGGGRPGSAHRRLSRRRTSAATTRAGRRRADVDRYNHRAPITDPA